MRVKLPWRLSLHPLLLLLQSALLLVIAAVAGPAAAADDCSSAKEHSYCLRESISTAGNARTLTVTILRQESDDDYYNVIVPGQPQVTVAPGKFIWVPVPDNGQVVYSVENCIKGPFGSNPFCGPWTQIVRSFAPVATCQNYANAAGAAVSEASSAGCGYTGARWDPDAQNHLNACLNFVGDWQSFVNNETNGRANDLAACKTRIAAASKPIKITGAGSSTITDTAMVCQGGGMSVTPLPGSSTSVFVSFVAAPQGANAAQPAPGQCAWSSGPIGSVWNRLGVGTTQPMGQQLLQVAQNGGSFTVEAHTLGNGIVYVDRIDSVQPSGGAASPGATAAAAPPAGSGYVLACQGGGDMRISGGGAVIGGPSFFTVAFGAAAQGANAAPPGPGTCAWIDRALRPGEPLVLNIPNNLNHAGLLKQAIAGGTFQVHANTVGKDLLVNQIDKVQGNSGGGGISVQINLGGQKIGNGAAAGGNGGSVLQPPIAEDNGSGQPATIARAVNVHSAASGGTVLGSLAAGTAVTSLGCSKGWCHIQFAGGDGFVAQSFLSGQ